MFMFFNHGLNIEFYTCMIVINFITDAVGYQGAFFGPGTGPIVLEGVDCAGDEEKLLDCQTNYQQDRNCVHSRDAGVACSRTYVILVVFTKVHNFTSISLVFSL